MAMMKLEVEVISSVCAQTGVICTDFLSEDDWVRENRDENQYHNHDDQDSQLGTSLRLNVTSLIGPIGQYGHHKKNTGRGC